MVVLHSIGKRYKLLTEEELRESDIGFNQDDKLYVLSQSSLELVMERMRRPERLRAIELLLINKG